MKRENIIIGLSALAPFLLGGKSGGANRKLKLKEFNKAIPYCSTDKFYLFDDQIVKKNEYGTITYYFKKPSAEEFKKSAIGQAIAALVDEDNSIKPLDVEEAYTWTRLKPRTKYMKKASHWSVYFDADSEPILLGTDGSQIVVESADPEWYRSADNIVSISQKLRSSGGYIQRDGNRVNLFLPSIGKAISICDDDDNKYLAIDRGRFGVTRVDLDRVVKSWKTVDKPSYCTLKKMRTDTTKPSEIRVELQFKNGMVKEFNPRFIPEFKDINRIYVENEKSSDSRPVIFVTDDTSHLVMPMVIKVESDPAKQIIIDEKIFEPQRTVRFRTLTKAQRQKGL
jgi:hypothetical protein